jgi:hypothetical protein
VAFTLSSVFAIVLTTTLVVSASALARLTRDTRIGPILQLFIFAMQAFGVVAGDASQESRIQKTLFVDT